MQDSAKIMKKWPNPWQMGTHLRVLSESYLMNNMTGFEWFSKIYLRPCALDESRLSIERVKVKSFVFISNRKT